jgi:hypothetical protein
VKPDRRVAPIAAIGLLALTGCVAIYQGTPLDLPERTTPQGAPSPLVVGVREPEIRLDPDEHSAYASQSAVRRAIELVAALRASGRFARVDFRGQLPCAPDLLLLSIPNPDDPHYDHDHAMLYLLLGVIPVIDPYDEGHYFARSDLEERPFLFRWSRVEVFWLLSAPLALLPGWHWGSEPDRSDPEFAKFLDTRWDALTSGVTPALDPKCAGG